MPTTESLQPSLTPAERAIVKSYGNWTQFMMSYQLDPSDDDDIKEGKAILEGLAAVAQNDSQ